MLKKSKRKLVKEVVEYLTDIERDKPFFTRAKAMAQAALILVLSVGIGE